MSEVLEEVRERFKDDHLIEVSDELGNKVAHVTSNGFIVG